MIRRLFVLGLLLALLPAGPARGEDALRVTAHLGWEAGVFGGTTANKVPLKATPPKDAVPLAGLTNPRYSRIVMAGTKGLLIGFDAVPESPRLWVDHDFDGDLKDVKRVWLKAQGSIFTRTQKLLVTYPGDETPTPAEMRFNYMPGNGVDHLTCYSAVHRRGTVVLGGRLRLVALTDGSSDLRFDDPKRDKLFIDLDGDGRFATTGDAPERIIPGEPFRVGEEGWTARVTDMSGRAIEFERSGTVPAARPRTWPRRGVQTSGVKRTPPKESFDELKRRFAQEQDKTYSERYGTVNSIGFVGSPKAYRFLKQVAEGDDENNIQSAAVRALGNPAYIDLAGALLEDWARGGKSHLQSAALQTLFVMGHPKRGQIYREVLASGPKTALSSAAQYLAYERTPEAEALLLKAFGARSDPLERYYLYNSGLRNFERGPPVEQMLEAVGAGHDSLRAGALKDLFVLAHGKAREIALGFAAERPVVLAPALAATTVLGSAGDPESVSVLLALFEEEKLHANVKKAVLEQLRFLRSPDSIDVLVKALKAKHATTRQVVAEILAAIPQPSVTQALLKQQKREKDAWALAQQIEALGDHGDPAAIGPLLKRARKRASKDPEKQAVRTAAILALGRLGFGHGAVKKFMLGLLDAKRWEDRLLAVDAAGASGDARLVPSIARNLGAKNWQLRLAAIQALDALRCRSAITPLIKRLGIEEDERLRDALADALFRLTGQNFYDNARVWSDWWTKNQGTFEVPGTVPERIDSDVGGTGAGFYGIPVKTERVVFVIDQSGSMSAVGRVPDEDEEEETLNRLDVAVTEVLGAVGRLRDKARVNVVLFHSTIHPWQDELIPLGKKTRKALEKHLLKQRPTGGTNLYDGVERALEMKGVDTIFVLSDGVPGAGKYIATPDILRAVRRLNQTRRIAIHGISIGMRSDLLERLAAENGGRYVAR